MVGTLSMLDLARVRRGTSIVDGLNSCVESAQLAEQCGYSRVWYAEHHNLPTVASSSPAVLIAHVAAHTSTIKLGAGGVMLPNHAPLVIAEQYGTLATLHPGRIELGLGRAPGSDQVTLRAMRRDHTSSDTFPSDVAELRDLLDEAIKKLPYDYRIVFLLRDVEGLSTNETGEIVNLSVPAVKSRLHRARAFLRNELNKVLSV